MYSVIRKRLLSVWTYKLRICVVNSNNNYVPLKLTPDHILYIHVRNIILIRSRIIVVIVVIITDSTILNIYILLFVIVLQHIVTLYYNNA